MIKESGSSSRARAPSAIASSERPGDAEQLRVSDVAKTPIWIEFDGTFCFPFRAGPVPVIPSVNEGQGSMRFRQGFIELQCFGCCSLSLRKCVLRRYFTCWREASISIG